MIRTAFFPLTAVSHPVFVLRPRLRRSTRRAGARVIGAQELAEMTAAAALQEEARRAAPATDSSRGTSRSRRPGPVEREQELQEWLSRQ